MPALNLLSTSWCICLLVCCVQSITLSDSGNVSLDQIDQKILEIIHVCHRDDPELADCVQKTFYRVMKRAEDGIPEMDFPPIEPLYQDEIEAFNVAGFSLKFKDIVIKGMSQLKIVNNSASLKTQEFVYNGLMETMQILANYELTGSIFNFPLQTIGTIRVNGRNVFPTLSAKTSIITKDGIEFFSLEKIDVKLYIEDGSLWISNLGLFEGAINHLLNNKINLRFIIDRVTPAVVAEIGRVSLKIGNRVYTSLPFDVIFPKGTGPHGPVPELENSSDNTTFSERICLNS